MNGKKIAVIAGTGTALDGAEVYQTPDNKITLSTGQELTIAQLTEFNKKGWLKLEPQPVAPELHPAPKISTTTPSSSEFKVEDTPVEPLPVIGSDVMDVVPPKKKNKFLSALVNLFLAIVLLGVGFGIGYLYRESTIETPKAPVNNTAPTKPNSSVTTSTPASTMTVPATETLPGTGTAAP